MDENERTKMMQSVPHAGLAVLAIGGNALAQAHQQGNIEEQFDNARRTCTVIAQLVEQGWDLVLTHGNGPQVGNSLLRVERAAPEVYRLPLDIIDADTQGGIGYMLQQVLGNQLRLRGIVRTVVALVTQVSVAAEDPAFQNPTKPIGPFMTATEAEHAKTTLNWNTVEDSGRGHRRVVPSPTPIRIVEIEAIRAMVAAGLIPIAVGGGGVPVVEEADGRLFGAHAVIDKDRASALLALEVNADLLIILTGVPNVAIGYGTPEEQALTNVSPKELRQHLLNDAFPPGSMGPKIEAVLSFVDSPEPQAPERLAIITDQDNLLAAVAGTAGTRVHTMPVADP